MHSFCSRFWRFFDTVVGIIGFLSIGQKDAQGSVSSLRVRMKRVWALLTRLAAVGIFKHMRERCARVGFPLRVRMKRVWAPRARLAAVFGGSSIRLTEMLVLSTNLCRS